MILPSFRNHRQVEKMALKSPTKPKRMPTPFTRFNTTIATTGRTEASTVPMRLAALAMPESGYSAIFVPNCELLLPDFFWMNVCLVPLMRLSVEALTLFTYKVPPYYSMVFRNQVICNPACELIRAWPLSKGHEIHSLSPDIFIATSEIDSPKSRSSEPFLQSLQVV